MSTVSLLRSGSVVSVAVPTSLNTDDDCRVWLAYQQSKGMSSWNESLVVPFVEAFNSGTVALETIVSLANAETIATDDVDYPITADQIRAQCGNYGHTLAR